jgi:hypothetical protein
MIKTNDEKVREAIAYLRSRDRYLLDGCKWVPTPAGQTDVRQTIKEYREAVKGGRINLQTNLRP